MIAAILPNLVLFLLAGAIGAMLFFGAGVAPVVFKTLDEERAGTLIRAIFPVYYLALGVTTAAAGVLGGFIDPPVGFIAALVAAGFLFAGQVMMPRINQLRDRAKGGDSEAQKAFDKAHRWSVQLNYVQLIALIIAFWTLAMRGA